MSTPRVSFAIICGDAHRETLLRLLRTLAAAPVPLAAPQDEIVVCWNGRSTDAATIAQEVHAALPDGPPVCVHAQEWTGHFARARNESFKRCTGEWIFWIDADDVIPDAQEWAAAAKRYGAAPLGLPLAERLAQIPEDVTHLYLPYQYAAGPPDEVWQLHPRILRRGAEWRSEGSAHEEFRCDRAHALWGVLYELPILHRPVQAEEVREARNVEILTRELTAGNATPLTLYYLARAHHAAGDFGAGVELYERALLAAGDGADRWWHRHRYQIAMMGVGCAVLANRRTKACEFAAVACETRPDLCEAHFARCVALAHAGRGREAVGAHRTGLLMRAQERGARPVRFCEYPDFDAEHPVVLASAATAYAQCGDERTARRLLKKLPRREREALVRGAR